MVSPRQAERLQVVPRRDGQVLRFFASVSSKFSHDYKTFLFHGVSDIKGGPGNAIVYQHIREAMHKIAGNVRA